MRNISFFVSVLSFVICQSVAAEAGEVRGRVNCNEITGYCLIKGLSLKGSIDDSTTDKLLHIFQEFSRQVDEKKQPEGLSHTEIKLDSPGGSVPAAMAIGRLLRQHRMTAIIKPGAVCNSACVLIYAGAVYRAGHFNSGVVGIHQPYFEVSGQPISAEVIRKNYAIMLQDMKSYLHEMNVSEQLADEMLKTPANAVHYLTHEEQDRFGLVILDPVETEISDLEHAKELGIDRLEFIRRQALIVKTCPLDSRYDKCNKTIYETGKVPPPESLPDYTKFSVPAE